MTDTDKALDIIARLMDERQELREQWNSTMQHLASVQDTLAKERLQIQEARRVLGDYGYDDLGLEEGIEVMAARIKELELALKGDGSETCREISKILQDNGYGGRGLVEPVRTMVRRIKELEDRNKRLEADRAEAREYFDGQNTRSKAS